MGTECSSSTSCTAKRGSSSGNFSEILGVNSTSLCEEEGTCSKLRDGAGGCFRYLEIDSPGRRIGWYPGGGPYSLSSFDSVRFDSGRAYFDSGMPRSLRS